MPNLQKMKICFLRSDIAHLILINKLKFDNMDTNWEKKASKSKKKTLRENK